MNRSELRALIQGPVSTVPTPMDDHYELDLGAMAELSRWWVDNGLVKGKTIVKVAAAMGEGPDLRDDEWPHLLRTVVQATEGKAAVVCGLKTKDTRETIEDAKRAQDLGAIGVQIDLPLFHHPVQDDMVRFYTDISDAINIGILIYNTWWFSHPGLGDQSISPQSLIKLKDAEYVIGVKWSVPPDDEHDYDDMRKFSDFLNVIDNSNDPVRCHKNGGRGYITSTIHAHPPHDLRVWELLEDQQYAEAQALVSQLRDAIGPLARRSSRKSGGYRLPKGISEVMGQRVGPPRPPTLRMDEQELEELRAALAGLGWPVVDKPVAV